MRYSYHAHPLDGVRLNGLNTLLTRRELLTAGGDSPASAETTAPVRRPTASNAETATPYVPGELSSFLSMCRFLNRFRVAFCAIALCAASAGLFIYLHPGR
jgi:hypothetical protein